MLTHGRSDGEVDLLLDPLKSELNWPMGTKRAIDLVDSVKNPNSASGRFDHDNCLRGKLPFHVLDALFVASALAEVPDSEPTAEQVGPCAWMLRWHSCCGSLAGGKAYGCPIRRPPRGSHLAPGTGCRTQGPNTHDRG